MRPRKIMLNNLRQKSRSSSEKKQAAQEIYQKYTKEERMKISKRFEKRMEKGGLLLRRFIL